MSPRSPFQTFRQLMSATRLLKSARAPRNPAFWQRPQFSTTIKMSSIGGAGIGAGFYAVVSSPVRIAAQPEGSEDKAHHLKNGRFTNPWDSYVENSPFQVMKTLLWSDLISQFPICNFADLTKAQNLWTREDTRYHSSHGSSTHPRTPPHARNT
jgi:hypothetical protein